MKSETTCKLDRGTCTHQFGLGALTGCSSKEKCPNMQTNKPKKQFTIIKKRFVGRGTQQETDTEITGDLDYLINYFSYTLEIGASYNPKINRHPKTIKSFISNLKEALNEKEGACYNRTLISLKEPSNTNTDPSNTTN